MLLRVINIGLWLSAIALCLFTYALLIEPSRLQIRKFEFTSQKYKGPDVRIAIITDIHIGGIHVPPSRVKKLVKAANRSNVDLVLMPGDFVSGHLKAVDRSDKFTKNLVMGINFLSDLEAPSFATLGNHDAWYGTVHVSRFLSDANVTILENRSQVFGELCLVGLADAWTSKPSRFAYKGCPANHPPLVFTHSPDAWRAFRSDTMLAIAGHTHGGQVNLPVFGRRVNATSLGPEHSYGFSKLGGVDLFVSAGVGTSILPVRFRAPPEIVVITLTAK